MTHRRTWQKFEARVAAYFGTVRKALSGSGGQEDQTRSDSLHPTLYIECKYSTPPVALVTLWKDARRKAAKEGKGPVVVACTVRGTPEAEWWMLVRNKDLVEIAQAHMLAEGGWCGGTD
jgi:hypothetical protein